MYAWEGWMCMFSVGEANCQRECRGLQPPPWRDIGHTPTVLIRLEDQGVLNSYAMDTLAVIMVDLNVSIAYCSR